MNIKKSIKLLKKYWWILPTALGLYIIGRMIQLRLMGRGWIDSFEGKTWWDVLELLIVPITLMGIATVIEYLDRKTDREIAQENQELNRELNVENQREMILQNYIDFISSLITEKHLDDPQSDDRIRHIARVKTITALERLNPKRREILVSFLADFNLVNGGEREPIISLENANLSGVHLSDFNFTGANFKGANFENSSLNFINFSEANLLGVNFRKVRFFTTILSNTNLITASFMSAHIWFSSFNGADLRSSEFDNAIFFGRPLGFTTKTTMCDGKKYDSKIHTIEYLTGKKPKKIPLNTVIKHPAAHDY